MNTFNPDNYNQINLIDVDVQNDFCPGGSLAVVEGDLIVPVLNRLASTMVRNWPIRQIGRDFERVSQQIIASRDWHPATTNHFEKDGGIWPVHCVAGTEGAAFHPELDLRTYRKMVEVVSKGTQVDEDAFSAFQGANVLGMGLDELLMQPNQFNRIANLVGGLATDYCVKATVLDSVERGFETFVISDAARGVAPETTDAAIEEMKTAGAIFLTSDEIVTAYERR